MINILYASQTGTSEDVAIEVGVTVREKGWDTKVQSMEGVRMKDLEGIKVGLFLVSTTGNGQPPDSMITLWDELLCKSLEKGVLRMKFSVFGYGDSKYKDDFNIVARKLQKRLLMLGAEEVAERGLGDEQDPSGYRSQFKPWLEGVMGYLEGVEGRKENPQMIVESTGEMTKYLVVEEVKFLNEESERTTFFVEFSSQLESQPGDVLTLYPKNSDPIVNKMLHYFGLTGCEPLQKHNIKAPSRVLFKQYLNLSDTAPFLIFRGLHHFIADETLKSKLLEIQQDYREYYTYVKEYRRNVVELLEDFPVQMPLDFFLEHINFLKPRKYSIASCHGGIGLLVRLIEYSVTPNRRMLGMVSGGIVRQGLRTVWRGYVTRGKFSFDKSHDYFMVGVGTGVAPFVAFTDQIAHTESRMYLNFGNRDETEFYLQERLSTHQGTKRLVLRAAFSRSGANRMHVQQLFRVNKDEIVEFFDRGRAKIYICGPYSNFSDNVLVSLGEILELNLAQIKEMKKTGQIVAECW